MVRCQDWINAAPMKLQFAPQEFLLSLCRIFFSFLFLLYCWWAVPSRHHLLHHPKMPSQRHLPLFRLSLMAAGAVTRCIKIRPMTFPVQTVMVETIPATTSRRPMSISSPGPPIRHQWPRAAAAVIPTRQQGLQNPLILPWQTRSI